MPNQCTPKRQPIFVVGPSIAYIPLSNGLFALVDCHNAENLCRWNWTAAGLPNKFYAARGVTKGYKRSNIHMHKSICVPPSGMVADHINGNTLDNREANLRPATRSQNRINYKFKDGRIHNGIRHYPKLPFNPWCMRIQAKCVRKTFYFPTEEAAISARKVAVCEQHGEFSPK